MQTLTAGIVNIVPEGLILLVSLTAAVTAAKMARHGILAQQLNAIESLASVSVMCTDKTGTLTESALRVVELIPAEGVTEADLADTFGTYAASAPTRNTTLEAIHTAGLGDGVVAEEPTATIPFSSRRRWSALELDGRRLVLGAPEALLGTAAARTWRREGAGERCASAPATGAADASSPSSPPTLRCPRPGPDAELTGPLAPLGIVVLAEELRAEARETIAFFARENVALKVLSGDNPATVGAIARDLGIEATGPALDGRNLPEDDAELLAAVRAAPAIGRISPEDKARVVRVLGEGGEYVGMLGDGVNDVPALKAARLAIAQGSGTQMARSVSDLVLVSGEFGEVPPMVGEGRQILRNIQRVARLFVSKAIFTAFLVLAVAIPSGVFPMLPRQFTLTSTFTIGIPAFLLALAPSSGPWRPEGFLRAIARFSIPAGLATGLGILTTYLLARHAFGDRPHPGALRHRGDGGGGRPRDRLRAGGPAGDAAARRRRRSAPGWRLLFFGACAIPAAREYFEIASPTGGMVGAWLIGSAVAIVLLAAALRVVAVLERRARVNLPCQARLVDEAAVPPGTYTPRDGSSRGDPHHLGVEDPDRRADHLRLLGDEGTERRRARRPQGARDAAAAARTGRPPTASPRPARRPGAADSRAPAATRTPHLLHAKPLRHQFLGRDRRPLVVALLARRQRHPLLVDPLVGDLVEQVADQVEPGGALVVALDHEPR